MLRIAVFTIFYMFTLACGNPLSFPEKDRRQPNSFSEKTPEEDEDFAEQDVEPLIETPEADPNHPESPKEPENNVPLKPNLGRQDLPANFCGHHLGDEFSFTINNTSEFGQYEQEIKYSLFILHWIIHETDFIKDVEKQQFVGLTGKEVAARIFLTDIDVALYYTDRDVWGYAYVCPSTAKIWIHPTRVKAGGIKMARTLFHEMNHNIGLRHEHGYVEPIGTLVQKYFDANENTIKQAFANRGS